MSNAALVTPLTVRRDGPAAGSDLSRPKVMYFSENDLQQIYRSSLRNPLRGGSVIKLGKSAAQGVYKRVEVYESPAEIRAALIGLTSTSTDFIAPDYYAPITAAGSVLTGATAGGAIISKYLTRVTAATVNSNDAVALPAPSNGRNLAVIYNAATCPIRVFPHTASAFIDNGASGVMEPLAVGQRKHFATPALTTGGNSAVWQTAIDTGNLS